jgi:hypothetical protein
MRWVRDEPIFDGWGGLWSSKRFRTSSAHRPASLRRQSRRGVSGWGIQLVVATRSLGGVLWVVQRPRDLGAVHGVLGNVQWIWKLLPYLAATDPHQASKRSGGCVLTLRQARFDVDGRLVKQLAQVVKAVAPDDGREEVLDFA